VKTANSATKRSRGGEKFQAIQSGLCAYWRGTCCARLSLTIRTQSDCNYLAGTLRRIRAMAAKCGQSIPFKPVMVLAAFLYGALCLELPYPGRYQFTQHNLIIIRVDRMTGRAWQREPTVVLGC